MTYLRLDRYRQIQRMQEAQDRLAPEVRYSEESQRQALVALGRQDLIADPQTELCLTPAQAHSPPTVAASTQTQAPSVRRSA